MSFLEKLVQAEMEMLFKLLDKFGKAEKVEDPTQVIAVGASPVLETSGYRLEKYRKKHNCLYILMWASSKRVNVFITCMAGVGMAFCIACNFVYLTMYNAEDQQLFYGCAFGVIVCINGLIIFFCHHASLPLVYTEETILHWRGVQLSKLERKMYKTLIPFGFTLGPFFLAKRSTALDLMATIFNCTITLLLA